MSNYRTADQGISGSSHRSPVALGSNKRTGTLDKRNTNARAATHVSGNTGYSVASKKPGAANAGAPAEMAEAALHVHYQKMQQRKNINEEELLLK